MAEVTGSKDIPENVIKALEAFVIKQCLQLHALEGLMGTPERGKQVADFMRQLMGEFLRFNIAERTLITQFIGESNIAVQTAMEVSGHCQPMSTYKSELDRLLRASAELGQAAYAARESK